MVLDNPYSWSFATNEFSAIISGQMLEHNQFFWLSFLKITRVLKQGGIMIHIVPSRGPEHRAPHGRV